MSKAQVQTKLRSAELARAMSASPELFYRIQQNYEVMINLAALIDYCVQDINEDAPFLFHDKAQCFRRLNRDLDECLEYVRKDPFLYADKRHAKEYEEATMSVGRLMELVKGLLLHTNTEQSFTDVETLMRLHIIKPSVLKADKYRIAHETLKRHRYEYSPEVRKRWEDFEEANKA